MKLLFTEWPAGAIFHPLVKTFIDIGHDASILSLGAEYTTVTQTQLHRRIPNWNHSCNSEIELDAKLGDIQPDLFFLWNGNFPTDEMVRRVAQKHGIECIWSEFGWFPQRDTVYFDPEGTNAQSAIRRVNLDEREVDPRLETFRRSYGGDAYIRRQDGDYIFAPLQIEADTNIKHFSPFRTMDAFLGHLSRTFPNNKILARPRPGWPTALSQYPNVVINSTDNLFEQIAGARFVVGINSTVLLEAMLLGKPVVAFGEGLFSGLGICAEPSRDTTRQTIEDALGQIDAQRIDAFLSDLVFRHMFRRADIGSVDEVRNYHLFRPWV